MFHNPAYQGRAAFGQTPATPFTPQRLREQCGRPAQPCHTVTVADGFRSLYGRLAKLLDGVEEDVLAYLAFPQEH